MALPTPETKEDDGLAGPRSSYRLLVGISMFFTYAVFGMSWAACGAFLKAIMADMNLSLSQASFLTTSVSTAKIIGPVFAGFIVARLGLRWAFMSASALICLGIFAPMTSNYGLLLLARFGMGIGGAMVVVYLAPLTVEWFPRRERVVMNGLNGVSANTGIMVALFVTPLLMRVFDGSWRRTLVVYSAGSVVLALMWLLIGRSQASAKEYSADDRKSTIAGYVHAIRDANIWKIAFAFAGTLTTYLVLFTYFPTYYSYELGFTRSSPVFFAPAIAMGAGVVGTLLGIYVTNAIGRRIPLLRYPGLLFTISIFGMIAFRRPALIVLSAVTMGFCLFLAAPAIFTIPQELPGHKTEDLGYVMGVFWSTCYAVATINVWLVGKIIDSFGNFRFGLLLVGLISSSMFIISFVLPETGGSRR